MLRFYYSSSVTYAPNTINSTDQRTSHDIRFSWYFTYDVIPPSQNYARTLTQGISLTDVRKLTTEYKRLSTQLSKIYDIRNLKAEYKRDTFHDVNGITIIKPLLSFIRKCVTNVNNDTVLSRIPIFTRFIDDETTSIITIKNKRNISRKCDDVIGNSDITNRIRGFIGKINDKIIGIDSIINLVLFVRNVKETQGLTDFIGQVKDYFRCLYDEAVGIAGTKRSGDFLRIENETINIHDFTFRHFFIFVKILTISFVRDFILRRFLIAREELVLKSCITREIILESKIN